MEKTMQLPRRSFFARVLAGALVPMLFTACGTDGASEANFAKDHAQAMAVVADDAGVCVATPPSTDVSADALAADAIEMMPELAVIAGDGGTSPLLPDAGGPGCASWCFAVANQGNTKCNASYASDVQQCSDIWYWCMGWPLMRCFAKADCDADYNACVASAAKTRKMCNNLVADQYNSCLANVCGEAQN